MSVTSDTESGIRIPGTSSHFLDPAGPSDRAQGRLRYITGGTGAFEGATGTIHFRGTSDAGFGSGGPIVFEEITGTIAFDVP